MVNRWLSFSVWDSLKGDCVADFSHLWPRRHLLAYPQPTTPNGLLPTLEMVTVSALVCANPLAAIWRSTDTRTSSRPRSFRAWRTLQNTFQLKATTEHKAATTETMAADSGKSNAEGTPMFNRDLYRRLGDLRGEMISNDADSLERINQLVYWCIALSVVAGGAAIVALACLLLIVL